MWLIQKDIKNGPPLAQGARRGVLTPSGIATGGGGAYPRRKTYARASKALLSRKKGPGKAKQHLSGYLPVLRDVGADIAAYGVFYLLKQLIWLLEKCREARFEMARQVSRCSGAVCPDHMRQ